MPTRFIEVEDFGVKKSVEVSEEVYRVYMRAEWREAARRRREIGYGVVYSTEVSAENGYEIPSDTNVEEEVIHKEELAKLNEVLDSLSAEDRELVLGKFDGITVRALAEKQGISKSSVSKKQQKLVIFIEEKMKNFKN